MQSTNVHFFGQVYKVTWGHYTDANDKEYIGVDQVDDLPYGLLSEDFLNNITWALQQQLKETKIIPTRPNFYHD